MLLKNKIELIYLVITGFDNIKKLKFLIFRIKIMRDKIIISNFFVMT